MHYRVQFKLYLLALTLGLVTLLNQRLVAFPLAPKPVQAAGKALALNKTESKKTVVYQKICFEATTTSLALLQHSECLGLVPAFFNPQFCSTTPFAKPASVYRSQPSATACISRPPARAP